MFSKFLQAAKESASQVVEATSKTVRDTHINVNIVTEKTNAYFRDTISKVPDDCTFITSNIIGSVGTV